MDYAGAERQLKEVTVSTKITLGFVESTRQHYAKGGDASRVYPRTLTQAIKSAKELRAHVIDADRRARKIENIGSGIMIYSSGVVGELQLTHAEATAYASGTSDNLVKIIDSLKKSVGALNTLHSTAQDAIKRLRYLEKKDK